MSSLTQNPPVDPVMLDLFRTELETHARVLEEGLVKAEAEQSPKMLEPLMRAAHSIKGAARMIGLDRAVRLAHAMEDVLSAAQRGALKLSAAHVEALLHSNDVFLHAATAPSAAIPAELEKQAETINRLIVELAASLAGPPLPPPPASRTSPPPAVAVDAAMLDMFRAELETNARVLKEGLAKPGAESAESLRALSRAAHSIKGAARIVGMDAAVRIANAIEESLLATQRGTGNLTSAQADLLLQANDLLLRVAALTPGTIAEELERQSGAIEELIARMSTTPATPAAIPAPPKPEPATASPPTPEDQSVRVRAESLNRLVGLTGECVVQTQFTRSLLTSLQRLKQDQNAAAAGLEHIRDLLRESDLDAAQEELERSVEQFRNARNVLSKYQTEYEDWSRRLEVLADSLYSEAVSSRMRPFADGTHGFPRMIRDLARNLRKEVRLEIDGASTPVDRDILDRLESPLTHLLRNSLDHGIELPADRVARGKPPEGKLVLSAHHVSGMLRISVTDDGAGVNLAAVRRKIVDGGYLTEEMARSLAEAEIMEFLFLPGFSTARVVTETSGRGVGLDVVHTAVRAVGGSVRVQSTPGAGTTIELQLPLTLAIVRSLLVDIGGQVYAIPLTRIDRLLRTTLKDLQVLEDRQFCDVDGKHVGVLDARQVLEGPSAAAAWRDICLVIISDRLSCYGLAVDRFLGQRDLVVKPLPDCLGKVPNISTGAILDDGTPALVLDVDDLVRSMDKLLGEDALRKVMPPAEPAHPRTRQRLLVVDDSITVREVERRLLENQGYEVVVAVDGMEAWNAIQRTSFDLLVTDVDMPRMDGIELIRRVRSAPRTASLPVVIVSYKEQPEYRIKGMEAGANYYLTKSTFHDESLVSAVRDLIGEA